MSLEDEIASFMDRVLTKVAEAGMDKVRPQIVTAKGEAVQTLQDFLNVVAGEEQHQVFLQIPHYWAVYVHDGRGSFGPHTANYLVWFRDKLQDPRTDYGTNYPIRDSQIRRLTKEQFAYGMQLNREARARGELPPMIVTKFQPKIERGVPFFSDGMDGFSSEAAPLVRSEWSSFLAGVIPPDEQDEVKLNL